MRYGLTSIACLLISLLMTGCASVNKSPYPESWPQAVALDAGCRQINGRYRSGADRQTYLLPHDDILLALTLLPPEAALKEATSVSLDLTPDGSFKVAAYAQDGTVLSRQDYPVEDGIFRCKDGALLFEPAKKRGTAHAADNPLLGVAWGEVALQRAQDGSLLMRTTSGATGMAYLLIPVYAKSEHWYLFRPVNGAASAPGD
jgi:hypothetical protein